MELSRVHKTLHHSYLGEEKHQMLNLNHRLETYLSRVKLLEEENALLAKEIQALRRSSQGASTRRKGLEEELRHARLEVEAAWRDRVHTELEVCRVAEELQALDLQRQREVQAQLEAKKKLEMSRKELEEEQRAQIWLREKVNQLEHDMSHLIQNHQEDVAHLEATLTHSRATIPSKLIQRDNQTPNLLQLGQEFSQRATRAWQVTAEAYQGQLDRLEESLNQTRSCLTQVGQEKSESQLKLQVLKKEITSAHEVRLHLEKTAAQQGHRYNQEIQQLQEHLEGLEVEKEDLAQQIDGLVLENRDLLQQKMSLGLEVATYRALLDSESIRGDIILSNQPRNISITDFSPQGIKRNYQTQQSTSYKTTSLPSARGITGPTATTATAVGCRKPVTLTETPKISTKPAYEDTAKSAAWDTSYPKILQDGAFENFRPQEVHEKVTYAEPLSPPSEPEAETTSGDKEEAGNNVGVDPPEEGAVVPSIPIYQVESGLSTEPPFTDEVHQHQFTMANLTPYNARMTEELCGFSNESDKDEPSEIPVGKGDMQQLHAPVDAWIETEFIGKDVEHVREETSESETEAVLEPNFDSRTSSPVSECEPEESLFNNVTDFSQDENILKEVAAEIRQEVSCSIVRTNEMDVEDKLYPDGEEMDTWDSVIERKVDLGTEESIKKEEEKQQHAEPEEDISARDQEHEKREIRLDFATDLQQHDNVAYTMTDTQVDGDGHHGAFDQELAMFPDNEEDDEEEDSQNVSVSWRTEMEGDSYAQENTLADTRPLIRYRSDETDANTQASHMDDSESSEGEQEKKVGETETSSVGNSKWFGTMEDLCEEVEGQALDEEYNLGYTHIEDGGVDCGTTVSQQATEETIKRVFKGHSDEETEELTKHILATNVCYDEELETDRLVEQELENLATDSYSAHFQQQRVKSVDEMAEQEPDGLSSCADPEVKAKLTLASSTTIIDQPYRNLHFSDSSVVMSQADTVADEEAQYEDPEVIDAPEKREEEDEHNVSMVTHADVTDDHSGFTDFFSRPEMEETNNSEDPNFPTEVTEVAPIEASSVSHEHLIKDFANYQDFPEAPETAEWEVLENPSEDCEVRDQSDDNEKCEDAPELPESCLHDDGRSEEEVMTRKYEPLEISPDIAPDDNDIFVVNDSTELFNPNGKDNSLHDFFSSGLRNDFWASSLETGATCQPDDACNEAAEQTNQN